MIARRLTGKTMSGVFSDEYPTLRRLLQHAHDSKFQAYYLVRQVVEVVDERVQVGHFLEEQDHVGVCIFLLLVCLPQVIRISEALVNNARHTLRTESSTIQAALA